MPDWSKKEPQTVARPIVLKKKVARPAAKAKKKIGKKK